MLDIFFIHSPVGGRPGLLTIVRAILTVHVQAPLRQDADSLGYTLTGGIIGESGNSIFTYLNNFISFQFYTT